MRIWRFRSGVLIFRVKSAQPGRMQRVTAQRKLTTIFRVRPSSGRILIRRFAIRVLTVVLVGGFSVAGFSSTDQAPGHSPAPEHVAEYEAENATIAETAAVDRSTRSALKAAITRTFPDAEFELVALSSPPRFSQRPCLEPQAELPNRLQAGRVNVRVRCKGKRPWSFFIQYELTLAVDAIVATRPLNRGDMITADAIALKKVRLVPNMDVFTQKKAVVGTLARRSLGPGNVIQTHHLSTPPTIRKGDRVVVQARAGSALISTAGEALASGKVGQQIPVENIRSGRRIQGWIVAPGVISTQPPRPQSLRVRRGALAQNVN